MTLDLCRILSATAKTNRIVKSCERLVKDKDKEKREEKQLCRVCYYDEGYYGVAIITHTTCLICGKQMSYSNTCIDLLCIDCAKHQKLCKKCGATMDEKPRREHIEPLPDEAAEAVNPQEGNQ